MGCGGSRLRYVSPESIPSKFRPILRRRVEEIRRRRRLGSTAKDDESTKKELLLVDEETATTVGDRKSSVRSPEEDTSCVTSEGSKGSEKKAEIREIEQVKETKEILKEEVRREDDNKSEGEVTDLEDDVEMDCDDDDVIFPGSPSFRIYFVDNAHDDDDDDGDDHGHGKEEGSKVMKMQTSDLDLLSPQDTGSKPTVVKKVRKRRSLKKVIPKGGQAAMKNLLNVKSCYAQPCGTAPHDRHHLLSPKPQP